MQYHAITVLSSEGLAVFVFSGDSFSGLVSLPEVTCLIPYHHWSSIRRQVSVDVTIDWLRVARGLFSGFLWRTTITVG